jgi:hypothetical protein
MKKSNKQIPLPFCFILLIIAILASSCSALKLLVHNDSLQTLTENDLSKFDGDYEIFSIDSSFRTSEFALTYSSKFDFKNLPNTNDRINLLSTDRRHLKVTVYKNDKVIKTKIIKGYLSQSYFHFKLSNISTIRPFYFILNGYATQRNRIGLLKNGDLTLDSDGGAALLLVIMPIFGSGTELYNLVFKRKAGSS